MNTTLQFLKSNLPEDSFQMVNGFLNSMPSERSSETYCALIKRWVEIEKMDPLLIKAPDLESYVKRKSKEGANPQSVKSTVTALRSLFTYTSERQEGYIHPLKRFRLRMPNIRNEDVFIAKEKVIPMDKIKIVIDRIKEHEDKTQRSVLGGMLFFVLSQTGLRITECLNLNSYHPQNENPKYFNYLKKEETGRYKIKVLGKNRKLRQFLVSEDLGSYFDTKTFTPGQPLFLSSRGTRLKRHGAHAQMKQIHQKFMLDLGIKNFSCHNLRSSLCSYLLTIKGEDSTNVARQMGHTSAILEKYYLHLDKDMLKDLEM